MGIDDPRGVNPNKGTTAPITERGQPQPTPVERETRSREGKLPSAEDAQRLHKMGIDSPRGFRGITTHPGASRSGSVRIGSNTFANVDEGVKRLLEFGPKLSDLDKAFT